MQESALRRIPNRLRRAYRCLLNHPARGTMGLKNIYCPRQTLAYLNQLSERISQLAKLEAPFPYLVTSILRTQEHQNHLQKIGYPVLGESSHCTGYAADIEQLWYEKNMPNVHKTMQKLLQQDFGEKRINLIDYQRFWHVCLNPFHPKNHIAAKSCN